VIKKTVLVILMLLSIQPALNELHAQLPDTISLKTVDIMGSRATVFTGGTSVVLTDSTRTNPFQNQSVSELLSASSAVFIKTYGSGGSATISSRGTEARHNAVLWNGFNINSASLGLTDLSMIPAYLTDKITLFHGGSSPVNGNSAIGGSVVLENTLPQFNVDNATTVIAEGGSFGNAHGSINTKWSNRFMESKTILFYDEAKNNFNYINYTHRDKPEVKQQHASYQNYGLVQDFQFKINEVTFISTGLWYQVTERELPPLMTNPNGTANQRDSTWRMHLGYKMVLKKSVLSVKGAYFREFQYYDDAHYNFNNSYLVNNYFGEAEWRVFIHEKLVINSGVTYNNGQASFDEYAGTKNRMTTALFSDIRYRITPRWQVNLNLRQEFSNIANPPFSPSVIVEGELIKNYLNILAKAGRNYSLPSMNDLYWIPGGNPELKPEDAWGEELSLLFFKNHKNLPAITITGFNTVVENWIKWQPAAGGIYAPNNLRQVHARGIETAVQYSRKINKWFVNASLQYALCRSTVSETDVPSENATIDKQLIYVPEHVFNANVTVKWQSIELFLSNSYIGDRYTTGDNSSKLESYNITNLSIEKTFANSILPLSLYLKVMNLFDTTYQVLAYRPMPGRWFSMGVKINLHILPKTSK
jgi:vitamin B12 transporter